jgi:glycosyltransferase involved in cell wall biosynthesis
LRVSVATICLNQAAYVAETIESVLAQDHDDVEYIIVDAGSTDGSRDQIERYRDRVARIILEPDDGPADGLNKALEVGTGEIWGCVNADDLLLPHAASAAVKAFEREPLFDVVYGDGYVVDAEGGLLRQERSDKFTVRRCAYGIGIVVQQATFIRRAAALRVGGYNVSNRTCWDGELLLDLALAGAVMRHVDDIWGVFRIHPHSITGSQRARQQYEADRRRLFERATGRSSQRRDEALLAMARMFKVLVNARWRRGRPHHLGAEGLITITGRRHA